MYMSSESLLVILIVGLVAGWLAGQLVHGTRFGLIGDLVLGVGGALVGGWRLPQLGIHLGSSTISAFIDATIGRHDALTDPKIGSGWKRMASKPRRRMRCDQNGSLGQQEQRSDAHSFWRRVPLCRDAARQRLNRKQNRSAAALRLLSAFVRIFVHHFKRLSLVHFPFFRNELSSNRLPS